jgi:DNA-binding response OmpR family regulator
MLPPGALVVALTGYGQQDERIRTETSGFDRHVVKPVGFEEIRRLLSEIDRREPH